MTTSLADLVERKRVKLNTWAVIFAGLFVVVGLVLLGAGPWVYLEWWIALGITIAIVVAVFYAVKLSKKFFAAIGAGQKPRMALILEWGNAIAWCNQGLIRVHYPSETVVRFRTTAYTINLTINDAWTKKGTKATGEQMQRVAIKVTIAFTLPRPGASYAGGLKGEDLLRKFYFALPFDSENFTITEHLGPHLSGAITAGVIHAVGKLTHTQLAKNMAKLEAAVKKYLLEEDGNLYKALGIPEENTDIGITSIVIDEEVEAALRQAEVIFRTARANQDRQRVEAATARETADDRAAAAEKLIKVYQESNIPGHLIPIMLNGAAGEPLDIASLRDLSLIQNWENATKEETEGMFRRVAAAILAK